MVYKKIIQNGAVEEIIDTLENNREDHFDTQEKIVEELISKIKRQDEEEVILNDLQDLLGMLSADAYAMWLSAGIRLAKATLLYEF